MPYKSDRSPLPFLDPKLNPTHPLNNPPSIDEYPHLPLGKRLRRQMEQEAIEKALASWSPDHVRRSWEADPTQAEQYRRILSYSLDNGERNFRKFAVMNLRLGYDRFHLSTTPAETLLQINNNSKYVDTEAQRLNASETPDPPDLPEPEVCWIMEYSLNECNIIRRKLALAMGLFPAVADPDSPEFDDDLQWAYDRRLYTRCHRLHKRCIRPSHIEIFASNHQILP
jgi:hypothetical protein